jgi:hypothetical protein
MFVSLSHHRIAAGLRLITAGIEPGFNEIIECDPVCRDGRAWQRSIDGLQLGLAEGARRCDCSGVRKP